MERNILSQFQTVPAPYYSPLFTGRITHYNRHQKILLTGEGDFSFSLCLASSFGTAHNMVPTSFDSADAVLTKYKESKSTLLTLKAYGAEIIHNVDATCMGKLKLFEDRFFDRIIYNFPHAGFYGSESEKSMIKRHRRLIKGFFRNAISLLQPDGEIHVTHKLNGPYDKWKLQKQASKSLLVLKEAVKFDPHDYPGYVNRKGDGCNSHATFSLGECRTFKFVYSKLLASPASLSFLGRTSCAFFTRNFEKIFEEETYNQHENETMYPRITSKKRRIEYFTEDMMIVKRRRNYEDYDIGNTIQASLPITCTARMIMNNIPNVHMNRPQLQLNLPPKPLLSLPLQLPLLGQPSIIAPEPALRQAFLEPPLLLGFPAAYHAMVPRFMGWR